MLYHRFSKALFGSALFLVLQILLAPQVFADDDGSSAEPAPAATEPAPAATRPAPAAVEPAPAAVEPAPAAARRTPIIVTSAYADQELLLESIKLYLVEYLIKPIKDADLTRVLTRCADAISENRRDTLIDLPEGYRYDIRNKTVLSPDGKAAALTTKEIELIELLLEHRGVLVTKQTIEEKLYRYEEAPPSALKNLVFKIRKKLPGTILKTVGKLGYTID